MTRPTIADVARAAGLSASTVDRVLNARSPVRASTAIQVLEAAEKLGFYATTVIRQRLGTDKPARTFGFLLQQGSRMFYQDVAKALTEAAKDFGAARITAKIEFLDDLSPESVSEHLLKLGDRVDALALVAAEHPRVTLAIEKLHAQNVPSFALISALTAPSGVGYVGLDNIKVGRTAAWAIANMCKSPGKVGFIVGNHRYRSQELNEIGFRSYFREHAPEFQILEPQSSFEDRRHAAEITGDLLTREPGLVGLCISGGGITGVIQAIREAGAAGRLVTVGYELMEPTRTGLIDGVIKLILSHPLKELARQAIAAMAEAVEHQGRPLRQVLLPFDVYTPENV